MKGHIILILVTLFFSSSLWANGVLRHEIDAEKFAYVVFIPLQEKGVISLKYYKEQRKQNGWNVSMHNAQLKEEWSIDLDVNSAYIPQEYIYNNDSIVDIFFTNKKGRGAYQAFSININQGKFDRNNFVGDGRLELQNFNVINNTEFASGVKTPSGLSYTAQALYTLTIVPLITNHKVYSISPEFYLYNKVSKEHQIIKPELKGSCAILATATDEINERFIALIKQVKNKNSYLWWYEYDEEGNQVRSLSLDQLNANNILSADISFSPEGEALIIGTYNYAKESRRSTHGSYTDGVFFSKIKDGNVEIVKFHSYRDLKNVFKYIDPQQMIRFSNATNSRRKQSLGFDLNMHQKVIVQDSQFVLIGEIYYPEYHLEAHYDMRGYWNYEEVFDGYYYTHGVAIAFDTDGELLWNNIMKLDDVFSFEMRENVLLYMGDNEEVMLYYEDGKIFSKGFNGNEVVFKERSDELTTVKETEAVIVENNGLIFKWYDSFFLISGYQEVESVKGKRKVFFFSKVAFE